MPLYEYRCVNDHTTETIRRHMERMRPIVCPVCGLEARKLVSLPAKRTDGIYSYAPNVGDPDKPEKARMFARGEKWDTSA